MTKHGYLNGELYDWSTERNYLKQLVVYINNSY